METDRFQSTNGVPDASTLTVQSSMIAQIETIGQRIVHDKIVISNWAIALPVYPA